MVSNDGSDSLAAEITTPEIRYVQAFDRVTYILEMTKARGEDEAVFLCKREMLLFVRWLILASEEGLWSELRNGCVWVTSACVLLSKRAGYCAGSMLRTKINMDLL